MTIDVSDQPRRTQFVISGLGPYPVTWEILDATDVRVLRDATALVLNQDYTVTINADGTYIVTLIAATGTTLTVVGARPYERLSDFQTGGDFQAVTVNREFDSLEIQILQLREEHSRTFRFIESTAVLPAPLDPMDLRGRFIGGDPVDGHLIAASSLGTALPVSPYMETVLTSSTEAVARSRLGYLDVQPGLSAAALQVAIDAAATARRQLVWRGGDYDIGALQLVGNTNKLDWIADGDVVIIQSANPTRVGAPVEGDLAPIVVRNKSGIRIRGIKVKKTGTNAVVDGNAAGIYLLNCTDVDVEEVDILGAFYVGLTFDGCDGFDADGVYVRGVLNRGIYPYRACKNGSINDPEVDGRILGGSTATTNYGINFNAANIGGSTNYIESVKVYGGNVRYCTHQGVEFGDLLRNCGIDGTTISDISQFYGVLVQVANAGVAGRVNVTDCNIMRCGQFGIFVTGCNYANINGNIVSENTLDGIRLADAQYCSVTDNVVHANPQAGITVVVGSGTCSRNKINDNTVVSNGVGLSVGTGVSLTRYNDNIIQSNTTNIADSGTSSSAGTNTTT